MFWKLFKGRQKNGGLKMKENNLMKNGSGCFDPVAYAAMKEAEMAKNLKKFDEPLSAEETEKREVYLRQRVVDDRPYVSKHNVYRFHKLLDLIRAMCELSDFEIVGHIVLKDKRTGRIWK